MEPNETTEEQMAKANEHETQQELDNSAESASIPLGLGELDAVAGGAGGAGAVEIDGQVVEQLPNAMFQVQLDDGTNALCALSGQLRMNYVRIHAGDRVRVRMSPGNSYDGRVVWRYK